MSAGLVWVAMAIDANGHAWGHCPHEHATDQEAGECRWWPDPAPSVPVLTYYRQVRRPDARQLSRGRQLRRMRARQFGLPGVGE